VNSKQVSHPNQHKTGHFRYVLSSQSLGLVLKTGLYVAEGGHLAVALAIPSEGRGQS